MFSKKQVLTCLVLIASVMGTLLFFTAVAYEQSILTRSEQSAEFRETDEFREFADLFEEDSSDDDYIYGEEHIYVTTRGFWNDFPTIPEANVPLLMVADGTVLVYFLLSLFLGHYFNVLIRANNAFQNIGRVFLVSGILGYGIGHIFLYSTPELTASTELITMPLTWGARSFQRGTLLLGMFFCIVYCCMGLFNNSRYGAKLRSINPMIVHVTFATMILGVGTGKLVSMFPPFHL